MDEGTSERIPRTPLARPARAVHHDVMDATAGRDRTLLVVLIAVAALVVIALAVVFTRSAEPLDPSTPAGVVQRYAEDVIEGDERSAREHLVAEVREECQRLEPSLFGDVSVILLSTTERDDSADVEVSIVTTTGGAGLFGPEEYREDATFGLVRDATGWVIEAVPSRLAICLESAS